jgi:hypothetical protein
MVKKIIVNEIGRTFFDWIGYFSQIITIDSVLLKKGDLSFGATKIFHAFDITHKLVPDQENSEYLMRLGNIALSQCGGCPSGGGEAPKNVLKLKNR